MSFFLLFFGLFFLFLNWPVWQGKRSFGWEAVVFPLVGAGFLALMKSFFRVYVMYQFLLILVFVGVVGLIYFMVRRKFPKGGR